MKQTKKSKTREKKETIIQDEIQRLHVLIEHLDGTVEKFLKKMKEKV